MTLENRFLEFKSTNLVSIIFDGIRFCPFFLTIKRTLAQCVGFIIKSVSTVDKKYHKKAGQILIAFGEFHHSVPL